MSQTSAEKPPKNGGVRKANWLAVSIENSEKIMYANV
jgi:hypothetical protein